MSAEKVILTPTSIPKNISIRFAEEYCSLSGGYIRDLYIVVDMDLGQRFTMPHMGRAQGYLKENHPRSGGRCDECGRFGCGRITPDHNNTKVTDAQRMFLYSEYLVAVHNKKALDLISRGQDAELAQSEISKHLQFADNREGYVTVSKDTLKAYHANTNAFITAAVDASLKLEEVKTSIANKAKKLDWPENAAFFEVLEDVKDIREGFKYAMECIDADLDRKVLEYIEGTPEETDGKKFEDSDGSTLGRIGDDDEVL